MIPKASDQDENEAAHGCNHDFRKRKRMSNSPSDFETQDFPITGVGSHLGRSGTSAAPGELRGDVERPGASAALRDGTTSSLPTGTPASGATRTEKTTVDPFTKPLINAPDPDRPICANPSLQLDVDVLMLEYLLYQAISTQFHALRSQHGDATTAAAGRPQGFGDYEETAQRLLDAFQASLEQFQCLHPSHQLDAGTEFNIMILETIILLHSIQASSEVGNDGGNDTAAPNIIVNGLHETKDYLRRRMLTTSSDQGDHDALYGSALFDESAEDGIKSIRDLLFYGWTKEGLQDTAELSSRTFPTFRVLVRFMVLSARINQQMEEDDINEYWMRLACGLMVHAALEALEGSDFLRSNGDINPEKHIAPMQPGLLDCFAFRCLPSEVHNNGFIQYRRSPFDDALSSDNKISVRLDRPDRDEEQAISEMFAAKSHEWDTMRRSYLSQFRIPSQVLSEAVEEDSKAQLAAYYQQRVTDLRLIHPFAKTRAALVLCLESLWALNTSPSISGKPALVQIEGAAWRG